MKTVESLKPLIEKLYVLDFELMNKQDVEVSLYKKGLVVSVHHLTADYADVVYIPNDPTISPRCELSKWINNFVDLTTEIDNELIEKFIDKKFKKQLSEINKLMAKVEYDKNEVWKAYSNVFRIKDSFTKIWGSFQKEFKGTLEVKQNIKSFKLNGGYTAVFDVKEDFVKVGCQRFPKSVIKELAAQL